MRRKYYMLAALLIILFVTVNMFLLEDNKDIDRTVLISKPIAAKEKTLKKTFGTEGVVESSSVTYVYVEKDKGEIQSILVEEGQYIEEGTPLVEYRNDSAKVEIESLEQANAELELEKEKLLEDRTVLEEELSETESLPDIDGEEEGDEHVHPSYDQTRPIQYEINNIDYSVKQIELKQANNQAKIDHLKDVSSEIVIESEVTGIITEVHGERRADGDPILTIASSNPLWAVAYVDEEHIHKVEPGQTVLLYPEFMKANRVFGNIINVGAYPEKKDGADGQSLYPVTIEIEEGEAEEGEPAEDSADDNQVEEPEVPEVEFEGEDGAEGGTDELAVPSDEPDEDAADSQTAPLRIGAHMNADITLAELTGPTIRDDAVRYNKALVLQKGKLKQQNVVIGLHADKQYVIKKGLKKGRPLLREADLTIKTGTSYITAADWDSLTKKRMKQFTGKEFSLLYLHGLLR